VLVDFIAQISLDAASPNDPACSIFDRGRQPAEPREVPVGLTSNA
jgi:hypothetical protein